MHSTHRDGQDHHLWWSSRSRSDHQKRWSPGSRWDHQNLQEVQDQYLGSILWWFFPHKNVQVPETSNGKISYKKSGFKKNMSIQK